MTTDRVFHWRGARWPKLGFSAACLLAIVILLAGASRLGAQSYRPLSEAEMLQPPTPERLSGLVNYANQADWGQLTPMFRTAALRAYEKGRLDAAERWYQIYRWSALFAEPENRFIQQWIKEMQDARVVHSNLPHRYIATKARLGQWLSPGLQAWLVGDAQFSAEFFGLYSRLDYLPEVLRILNELHERSPGRFARYANLALAIAVVYDLPPPPDWPHGQASREDLARRLPTPENAFDWWIRQDQLDRTYHRLADLRADELKFVVDATAPFTELEWSQRNVDVPLHQLANAYTLVRYNLDRENRQAYVWTNGPYTLAAILGAGGICVDQAYFAIQVGKARAVPTLLFRGEGQDGRHAWFGFLDENGQWQLDAGRYGELRFVTGYARDPQTWKEISDHELKFLSERFRSLPAFHTSTVHRQFADDYQQAKNPAAAIKAAWLAVKFEPRNLDAWTTLLEAQAAQGDSPKQIEATLYQAIAAFGNYPDLEATFSSRLCASLRARGQLSAADFEEQRILAKNRIARGDLALLRAQESLQKTVDTRPQAEAIKAYNTLVDTQGRGAGIDFYDKIVTPFVQYLVKHNGSAEARQAADRARAALYVPPGSQLEGEFDRLFRDLKTAPAVR